VPSFATTEVLTCGAAFAAPGVATAAAAEAASATSAVTPVTADTTGAVMASPTAAWASVFAPLVAAAFAAGVVAASVPAGVAAAPVSEAPERRQTDLNYDPRCN